ncbi:MAG: alpha/beta hydrolase [Chloroflexota bacterium]
MDSRFVDTAFGRVHARIVGSGPAVMFIHGRIPPLNNWQAWNTNLEEVAAAGFRAVAVELPGFGDAARPDGPISTESAADCVLDIFDRLAISRVTLVGYNWGGLIAWRAAMIEPGRITKLALVAAEGAEQLSESLPGEMKVSTLILWVDADFFLPISHAEMFAKAIPNSQLHIFEFGDGQSELAARAPQKLGKVFNERLVQFLKE